jgi:hypothetical protein
MSRYATRSSPVRPMRIFIPTEESKTRNREDINWAVYLKRGFRRRIRCHVMLTVFYETH